MSPEPRTYRYAGELRGLPPPEPGSLQAGPPTRYDVQSCPDCGALVLDVRQHDRRHLVLGDLGHAPVVRTGGTIQQPDPAT